MDEERILTTVHGIYRADQWDGRNRSKIAPVCDKVVVLADEAVERVGSVIIPDEAAERQGYAATTGILIAVGPQAFAYDSDRLVRWEGDRPRPGDRIYFTKYAGQEYTGWDGRMYRLIQDRAIGGIEIPDDAEGEPSE